MQCPRCGKDTFNVEDRGNYYFGSCMICGEEQKIRKSEVEQQSKPRTQRNNPQIDNLIVNAKSMLKMLSTYSIVFIIATLLFVYLSFFTIGQVADSFEESLNIVGDRIDDTKESLGILEDNVSIMETEIESDISAVQSTANSNENNINSLNGDVNTIKTDVTNLKTLTNTFGLNITELYNTTDMIDMYIGDYIGILGDTDVNITMRFKDNQTNSTRYGNVTLDIDNTDLHEVEFIFCYKDTNITRVSNSSALLFNYTQPDNSIIKYEWIGTGVNYGAKFNISWNISAYNLSYLPNDSNMTIVLRFDTVYYEVDDIWTKIE